MTERKCLVFSFADIEVREREFCIAKGGEAFAVEPKAFRVLLFLLRNPHKLVTKEELLDAVWSDTAVSENSLTRSVALLRKLLGDDTHEPRYIATVPTVGYRFLCDVRVTEDGFAPASAVHALRESPAEPHSSTSQSVPPEKSHGPQRIHVLVALAAFIVLAGAGWLIYKMSRANPPAPTIQRALTRLTFDDGLQTGPTWSPDGRYIAYSSDRGGKFDIWVQQVSGGNPVQITKGPGQNWQPDWSPNGKYVAYRSEEGDGGIFVIPALGGLERKIAPFGYYPQWSPNSSQVLFQTDFTALGYNRLYIAQLDGSPPHEVLAEFLAQNKLWAASANWHPDGKRITIWAGSSPSLIFSPSPSFWTVAISGEPGIKLEIPPAIQDELTGASEKGEAGEQLGDYSFSWSPSGDAIYFERGFRGARNIWRMTVDPVMLRVTGVDRLTTGPGPDAGHAVSADGKRLAFTAKSQRIGTWLFSFDAKTGQITGNGTSISSAGRMSVDPELSRDGTKVAYVVPHGASSGLSFGDVRNEVWLKSLVDESEAPVIADDDYSRYMARWSPDGKQLVYVRRKFGTSDRQLMVWSSQNHDEQPFAAPNTIRNPNDWSPDGKWLLTSQSDGIWLASATSAPHAETAAQKIISHPSYRVFQPHLSPNGRWIVFNAAWNSPNPECALYIAPLSGGPWSRITDGRHWDDKPRWSPDGKIIYFVSGPGGFFNVWGIRFDPAAGKAVGQPFQVSRFENARLMIPRFIPIVGLSLTQSKLVMTMAQESGNIWVLDNVDH